MWYILSNRNWSKLRQRRSRKRWNLSRNLSQENLSFQGKKTYIGIVIHLHPAPIVRQGYIKYVRMYATLRTTWHRSTFYYAFRFGIIFWIDLRLSPHLPVLFIYFQPIGCNFWNVPIKFYLRTSLSPRTNAIKNCSDQTTFPTTCNITPYCKELSYQWITVVSCRVF